MSLEIRPSHGSGKACNGCAKTGTLQVIEKYPGGFVIKKQFRFTNGDEESLRKAYIKAREFVASAPPAPRLTGA